MTVMPTCLQQKLLKMMCNICVGPCVNVKGTAFVLSLLVSKVVNTIQEAAKKAADVRKRQRKSGDKNKEGTSAEAKPKSSKVCLFHLCSTIHFVIRPSTLSISADCIQRPYRCARQRPLMTGDIRPACLSNWETCSGVSTTRFWHAASLNVALCSCSTHSFACVCSSVSLVIDARG